MDFAHRPVWSYVEGVKGFVRHAASTALPAAAIGGLIGAAAIGLSAVVGLPLVGAGLLSEAGIVAATMVGGATALVSSAYAGVVGMVADKHAADAFNQSLQGYSAEYVSKHQDKYASVAPQKASQQAHEDAPPHTRSTVVDALLQREPPAQKSFVEKVGGARDGHLSAVEKYHTSHQHGAAMERI